MAWENASTGAAMIRQNLVLLSICARSAHVGILDDLAVVTIAGQLGLLLMLTHQQARTRPASRHVGERVGRRWLASVGR